LTQPEGELTPEEKLGYTAEFQFATSVFAQRNMSILLLAAN
jgi:hypothetical protein